MIWLANEADTYNDTEVCGLMILDHVEEMTKSQVPDSSLLVASSYRRTAVYAKHIIPEIYRAERIYSGESRADCGEEAHL
jgi:hypothetical protein